MKYISINYNDALRLMKKGFVMESIISKTQYEIVNGQLLAEGLPIKEDYITQEEREGQFELAHLVYEDSSNEEISEFLSKSHEHFLFNKRYEKIKMNNMIL